MAVPYHTHTFTVAAATEEQGAKADTALQPEKLSAFTTVDKAPVFYNVDGSGIPGIAVTGQGMIFRQSTPDTNSVHAIRIERSAPVGGVDTFEGIALQVRNTVPLGALNYENAAEFILLNNAAGISQNTAVRIVAEKKASGSTWGVAGETIDRTGLANPTKGLISSEQVLAANGTDANNNRVIYDAVASRPSVGNVYSGAAAEIGFAFRATNQIADSAANKIKVGFQAANVGSGSFDVAFDSKDATVNIAAFRMGNGQKFSFTSNTDRTMRYASAAIRFNNGTVDHWFLADNGDTDQFGAFKIQGLQVLAQGSVILRNPANTANTRVFEMEADSDRLRFRLLNDDGTVRLGLADMLPTLTAIGGTAGSEALRANIVTNAVNRVNVTGAVTGSGVSIQAAGADTNVNLTIGGKGTGVMLLSYCPPYANDAAASAAGVPLTGMYFNTTVGAVSIRRT